MNMMTRFLCKFVGWDASVLKECCQASYSQLYKMTSALLIIMGIWGVNGFLVSDLFLHLPGWACCLVSLVFMFVVWNIERIMILTFGNPWMMKAFRMALAFLMAVFGSILIDHKFFEDDINKELAAQLREEIHKETKYRQDNLQLEMNTIEANMEKLHASIEETSLKVAKNPVVSRNQVQKRATGEVDENGNPIMEVVGTTSQNFENPLNAKLKADQDLYSKYDSNLQELRLKKVNIDKEVESSMSGRNPGFLSMLEATYDVITQSKISMAAYLVFFLIMICLEMFVVMIKTGDTPCDYDLILENQLRLRRQMIEAKQMALSRNV